MTHTLARAVGVAVACAALAAACGTAPSSAPQPGHEQVTDAHARALLVRAFTAARWLGRADGLCRGCYPAQPGDITEDMNARTGDAYAIAFTPFGARLPDVVYVDTVRQGRLTRRHITLYSRTSNGTIWELDAGRGAPRLTQAE